MKKLLIACMIIAGMGIFTGCSDSPRDVAVKWGKALASGDVNTANKYSTEKTKPLNGLIAGMMSDEKIKTNITSSIKKWENGKEEIQGDSAVVFEKDPKDESSITLKKVDGKWMVDAQKKNNNK